MVSSVLAVSKNSVFVQYGQMASTFIERGFSSTFNDIFLHFRIDMVFHSSEFTTLSYRRIKTSISDHYPILIAFEMNKEN